MPAKIPLPVTFNPQKHHFRFLQNEIELWKKMNREDVAQDFLAIGNNLIDFYLGKLDVEQICQECMAYFQTKNIYNIEQFVNWLNGSHWKKIKLSDQSEWLIKMGNDLERYIHIHPAKYSKHTIRIRGTTLKTVLVLCIHGKSIQNNSHLNLFLVNKFRKELLQLSPVKNLEERDSKILLLWKLFKNNLPG